MLVYLTKPVKNYFSSYTGLSILCWQGIIFNFIEATLSSVIFFLSTYFIRILNLNIETAGFIISFYGVGAVLGGIISGKLSDKTTPVIVSIGSLLIQGIAFLGLIQFKSIHLLMFDMFILGFSSYGFLTSNYIWVLSLCNDSETARLKAINILSTVSNLGLALSVIFISSAIDYGFQYIFYTASFGLVLIAMCLFFQECKQINFPMKSECRKTEKQAGGLTENKKNSQILILILFCVFLVGTIISQVGTTYAIYIQDKFPQLGVRAYSIVFFLNALLIIIFQNPIVNLFRSNNKILMVGISSFLIGFGMYVLTFSFIYTVVILGCIIYTLGEMIFLSMVQLICYERASHSNKGNNLGLFRMFYASSRIAGPAAGGYIYNQFGGDVVWSICGIIGIFWLTVCNYCKKYD